MTNLIGKTIDRYHIREKIGEGGMATVYRVYDVRLERDLAIKIIRNDAFPPNQLDRILKRFEREAKSLARLSHSNIIKVIDYGEYDGAPFLVMEYLSGGTLKQRLGKPLPWQSAVKLLIPVAEALEYAHEQKIIHRDIKPSNILLSEKFQPVLTDFGIAKILETEETFTLTGTGIGVGTPEYMAPEQWTGSATAQSDIYSLGVVLYEMVTGRKPYTADTPAAILLKQATEPLPRPSKYVLDLPESVEKVLIKALAGNLQARYKNTGELVEGLESLLSGTNRTKGNIPEPIARKAVEPDGDTRDTYIQDETNSTRMQTHTGTKNRTAPTSYSQPSMPSKKVSWLPWTAAGMVICLLAVGVLSLGSYLIGKRTPAAAEILPTPVIVAPSSTPKPIVIVVTATDRISTETPMPPPPTVKPTDSSYLLQICDYSTEDFCVYSISPQPAGLIISFKSRQQLNPSALPKLTVNGHDFYCETLASYPGRLICNGITVVGNSELILFTSADEKICSGYFNIEKYVAPVPTKKSSGHTYP